MHEKAHSLTRKPGFSRFTIDSWTGAEFHSLTRNPRFTGAAALNNFEQQEQDCDHRIWIQIGVYPHRIGYYSFNR